MSRVFLNARLLQRAGRVFKRTYGSASSPYSGLIDKHNVVRSPFECSNIPETNLAAFITDRFTLYDKQIAFVDGITGREVSYSQLIDTSSRLSSGLRRVGLQKGDVLAACLPNSIEYANIFLGTMAAGGIVSTVNPAYSPSELGYQFKNSNAKYVATTAALLSCVQEAAQQAGSIEKIIVMEEGHSSSSNLLSIKSLFEDTGSQYKIETVNSKEDIAVLPYSSGTTGFPKGVMLTHYNLIANCCQLDHPDVLGVNTGEVYMSILPFFHIYGMVVLLFTGLHKGAKQIVLPKFEPEVFLRSIETHQIESAYLVPPLVLFLSKHEDVSKYDLSSLKRITCGAAPLGSEVVQGAHARTGVDLIRQAYGLTETSPVTHTMPIALGMEKPGSVGLPLPSVGCRVVDIDTGVSLGPNKEGEIVIEGPNVMKGYLNKPEATRECIDEDGRFHTGDIGYYDEEGHFFITDRLKELIKVKGFQVAPAELEALLQHHPEILDAAVIGVPHERLGEAPKAFVVRKSPSLRESDVQKFVEKNISQTKWLEGGVEFVDQVPKSPSGRF